MRTDCPADEAVFYRVVGQRLRNRRLRRRLALTACADALGVRHQMLSQVELAHRRPSLYTVARYARFLQMSLPEVFAEGFSDVADPAKPGVTKS